MRNSIVRDSQRNLMASVLRSDPNARKQYKHLLNMKAKDLHHDYRLVRQEDGTYKRLPDLDAWNGMVGNIYIGLIRHSDGEWSINS